jgi:hypothetical protein
MCDDRIVLFFPPWVCCSDSYKFQSVTGSPQPIGPFRLLGHREISPTTDSERLMRDITDLMNRYREASRHLWNDCFLDGDVDFDRVAQFDKVRLLLFQELVLESLGDIADDVISRLTLDHFILEPVEPIDFIRVVPSTISVPIMLNRGVPQTAYWDAEPQQVGQHDAEFAYVDSFDWDVRGFREFHYYRVRVIRFAGHPDTEGRAALLSVSDCRVFAAEGRLSEGSG